MSAIISSLVLIFCVSSLEFIDKAESSLLGEEKQCSLCPTCTPCSSCPVLSSQSCDNCQPRSENIIPVKNPEHRTVAFENKRVPRDRRTFFPIWKPTYYPTKCPSCPPVKECKKCKKCPRKTKCKKCKCVCNCKHHHTHDSHDPHGDPSPFNI
ncbi:uncharacterized protein [Parasteatoda tepidariorum]|uniref:uncharacterized protein isoform X2 n=1 Tax=Parasteatoda tepidariorum TaxID=114398 RepID=UPI0039BCBA7A